MLKKNSRFFLAKLNISSSFFVEKSLMSKKSQKLEMKILLNEKIKKKLENYFFIRFRTCASFEIMNSIWPLFYEKPQFGTRFHGILTQNRVVSFFLSVGNKHQTLNLEFRAALKPLNNTVLCDVRRVSGAPMMLRDISMANCCTSDR